MLECMQELHVFLEAEGPLGATLQWQQLQPMHGSILEGVARLPKQLFGMCLPAASCCCPYIHEAAVAAVAVRHIC